jgi:hypothetical protein
MLLTHTVAHHTVSHQTVSYYTVSVCNFSVKFHDQSATPVLLIYLQNSNLGGKYHKASRNLMPKNDEKVSMVDEKQLRLSIKANKTS